MPEQELYPEVAWADLWVLVFWRVPCTLHHLHPHRRKILRCCRRHRPCLFSWWLLSSYYWVYGVLLAVRLLHCPRLTPTHHPQRIAPPLCLFHPLSWACWWQNHERWKLIRKEAVGVACSPVVLYWNGSLALSAGSGERSLGGLNIRKVWNFEKWRHNFSSTRWFAFLLDGLVRKLPQLHIRIGNSGETRITQCKC